MYLYRTFFCLWHNFSFISYLINLYIEYFDKYSLSVLRVITWTSSCCWCFWLYLFHSYRSLWRKRKQKMQPCLGIPLQAAILLIQSILALLSALLRGCALILLSAVIFLIQMKIS